MTKHDYKLIASALFDEHDAALANFETYHAKGVVVVAKRLALEFALDNPRFDAARFLTACGLDMRERLDTVISITAARERLTA
jgi:hypothetical protein